MKEEKTLPLFKRDLLAKVMQGRKTQTRRTHERTWNVGRTYGIRATYYEKSRVHTAITRRFQQKLGDVTDEDARKEGFKRLGVQASVDWDLWRMESKPDGDSL